MRGREYEESKRGTMQVRDGSERFGWETISEFADDQLGNVW